VATQPARRKRHWGAVVTVGIAFVLLLALIAVLLVQSDFGKTTAVGPKADIPPVIGQQYAQAEATLTGLQFKVVRADADSDQAADQVLDQNPEAGSRVGKGSTVTLTVSSATIVMPDIIGKTQQEAAAAMQVKHLKPFFTERVSDKTPGTVIETLPAAGAKIPKPPPGTADPVITVFVAQEPPVAIPDVKGQDPTAATNVLNQAGFLTVTRTDTPSDTIPFGQVIGTDPPAGTPTPKTAPIKLLVSTGPSEIEVPNVVGQTQDDAAGQLQSRGFNVTIQQVASTPPNKGKVLAQSPPAGTKLKKLDNVTITVGL
jgi:serine/threonine-protein kinase